MQTILLDNLTLYPKAPSPSRGRYIVTDVEGWYSLPDSKTDFDDRPYGHGSFAPGKDWRSSIPVTIKGWYNGTSRAECLQAKSVLNAVGGRGSLVPVTILDELGQTSRSVSVRNVDIDDDHGRTWFPYAMDLLAPDPRRYGPPQQVVMPIGVFAASNQIANPSFETGIAGWNVQLDGGTVALAQSALAPDAASGTRYAEVTVPSGGAKALAAYTTAPITNSVVDHAQVRVRPTVSRDIKLTVTFQQGSGIVQNVTMLTPIYCPAGVWSTLLLEVEPPAGADTAIIAVDSTDGPSWSAGEKLQLDAAMVGSGTQYADGDTADWGWSGTRGNSPSVSKEYLRVDNPGTADTEPTITITGGGMPDGFSLIEVETSRLLQFSKEIPDGATTVIDAARRKILVNGSPVWGLLKHQWPTVPAGTTRRYQLTVPGVRTDRTMTVTFSPAWW